MNWKERDQLLDALLEGDISEADFLRLEAELSVDSTARRAWYERLALSAMLETEAAAVVAEVPENVIGMPVVSAKRWRALAAIAAAVAVAGGAALLWRKPVTAQSVVSVSEQEASGYAVLTGQAGAVWRGASIAEGALLPGGPLVLESGVAQMELFSGVTVVAEAGAAFEILSPMEMSVTAGKVRARVPEPAHGFRIRTAQGEVVDLGTEFAMNVSGAGSEVHVLDGEVEWHPRDQSAMQRMEKGSALRWTGGGESTPLAAEAREFVSMSEIREQFHVAREARRADWSAWSDTLKQDPRLVVSYQMSAPDTLGRHLPNGSTAGSEIVREGAVVAAARANDRWGRAGGALDFSPAGSRVRVSVPGEYRSLTLLCWVKINSLDRWYNSLFLTDGHELHEPHWQIRDDGRLFFSVKKRDVSPGDPGGSDKHIFYSPPFWNASLSGQWLMLATVYDVEARQVTHYLNGASISQEAIPAEYLVEAVSIGAASLGNWGMPERNDAAFAVRNLNGSMDEFALFAAALTPAEIADFYRHGQP